jgi:SAM-dependent methyltransferase
MNEQLINKKIASYYTSKLKEHGASPHGVDWNSLESQNLRFKQLLKIVNEHDNDFTLSDIGCGYGALYEYLENDFSNACLHYYGYDLSAEMIEKAKSFYANNKTSFAQTDTPTTKTDYVVSSGIFSVSMDVEKREWKEHILDTLNKMNEISIKGFSFNCLTKYSDPEYLRTDLYYADPLELFDHCKKNFSSNIALLHDYELYEFSILVRK